MVHYMIKTQSQLLVMESNTLTIYLRQKVQWLDYRFQIMAIRNGKLLPIPIKKLANKKTILSCIEHSFNNYFLILLLVGERRKCLKNIFIKI